jgi:hypothetical protein
MNMRRAAQFEKTRFETAGKKSSIVDTTFVLFFLALEFGRTFFALTLDNIFLFVTLLTIVALPYFLLSGAKPQFSGWFFGRTLIAAFGMLMGMIFQKSFGVILPETFKFLPMTFLIVTAMLSCYIQFYSFLRLRLAK